MTKEVGNIEMATNLRKEEIPLDVHSVTFTEEGRVLGTSTYVVSGAGRHSKLPPRSYLREVLPQE